MSMLQIYLRDFEGYKNTTAELIRLRPQQSACWISHAISLHFLKDYTAAVQTVEHYDRLEPVCLKTYP